MSRFIRLSILAAASAALVACGGGAKLGGGKEGAAKAAFEASQPAAKGGQGSLLQALASGQTNINAEVKVDCANGGKAELKVDLTGGSQAGTLKYEVKYDSCNEDGVNEFNGSMKMELSIVGTGTSADIALKLKGKIEISGDIDDFIDMDVTETISLTATGANSGTVTVKLNGTINTSEGNYVYNNESITITAGGTLTADDGNS
jgi:hypothetical protein